MSPQQHVVKGQFFKNNWVKWNGAESLMKINRRRWSQGFKSG